MSRGRSGVRACLTASFTFWFGASFICKNAHVYRLQSVKTTDEIHFIVTPPLFWWQVPRRLRQNWKLLWVLQYFPWRLQVISQLWWPIDGAFKQSFGTFLLEMIFSLLVDDVRPREGRGRVEYSLWLVLRCFTIFVPVQKICPHKLQVISRRCAANCDVGGWRLDTLEAPTDCRLHQKSHHPF